jgi:Fic family protein
MLPAGLVNMVAAIAELRERSTQRRAENPTLFTQLEGIAKVQSVKGSNAIEGIVTTDQRINAIVNQNSAPLNHDEAEIAGYRDALALIHQEYQNLDLREPDILELHRILLSYTASVGGAYKAEDNVILEIDAEGKRRIRFSTVPAGETAEAMEQLVLAYLDARQNGANQLLLIPCVILDFLCIHPFSDGNGRMSRLLSLLLLYRSGFDAGRYISFEEQINNRKADYYESLRLSSVGWHESTADYFPFIVNFISTLLFCYKELDKRFALVQGNKVTKSKRIEATVLNALLPISKAEISYVLPDVSPTTIEKVLGELVRSGVVSKIGSGRNTKYLPNK